MRSLIALFTFFLVIVTSAALLLKNQPVPENTGKPMQGESAIGGDFELIDANGQAVRDAQFRGKLMLVFFGFTSCPDLCPTMMTTVTATLKNLGDTASQVAPIFISIDPERDTPAQMKEFMSHFDPAITGLTGSAEQVRKAASAYKVYYAKSATGDAKNYMMDHSGYLYLMSRDGTYLRHFSPDASGDEIADAIRNYLR